jgi:hypothetical protein
MVSEQSFHRLGRQQRHVGRQGKDGGRVGARLLGLEHGVARAQALRLHHGDGGRPSTRGGRGDVVADVVGIGGNDDHDAVGEGTGEPECVSDERSPAQRMEHLGSPRPHALAFPRGENDRGDTLHRDVGHLSIHPQASCHSWPAGPARACA